MVYDVLKRYRAEDVVQDLGNESPSDSIFDLCQEFIENFITLKEVIDDNEELEIVHDNFSTQTATTASSNHTADSAPHTNINNNPVLERAD